MPIIFRTLTRIELFEDVPMSLRFYISICFFVLFFLFFVYTITLFSLYIKSHSLHSL